MEFTTRPEIVGTFGVASSTHWLASQTAMSVLERGGNAFDAAVAGGFVLQVVEPHLNGPGGEAPILIWSERETRMRAICGQGPAPALADAAAFRKLGLSLVPGIGLLPAVVPGAFGAWMSMLRDYGTWSVADVLAPAIGYARDGYPLVPRVAQSVVAVRELFEQEWHSSARVYLRDGKAPRPGALFSNPDLAATYERVVAHARSAGNDRVSEIEAALDAWYRGFVARAISEYYETARVRDTTGERNRGLLRYEDMAAWQASYEDPVTLDFGRFTVAKCGAWSQGPVFLQQLALLAHAGLDAHPHDSAQFVHRICEAGKLAFADRFAWYGDPKFVDVPLEALLSDDYARERWARVGECAATDFVPGRPGGHAPRVPDVDTIARETLAASDLRFGVGEPTFANLPPVSEWAQREIFVGDTCHLDVIDRHGNMVSATPSGGWLASSPVVPGIGFSISTRLQTSWLDDGVANQVAPRKRPCTTLSPSMALRDGEPYLAFGTPGGDQQDQWSLQFFLRHAVHGVGLQAAIEAPAWHINHFPGSFWPRESTTNTLTLESRMPAATIDALRDAGHGVKVGDAWSEGRLSACARERDSRGRLVLRAAANPRGMQGYAVGR